METPQGVIEKPEPERRVRPFGELVRRAVRRGLRPLVSWETLCFFQRDLSVTRVRDVVARIPLEVRLAEREEIDGHREFFVEAGKDWRRIEARLDRGDRCFLGLVEGRPVHFTWLTTVTAWIPEIEMTLRLVPGEVYLYDAFTVETARGHGVQPAVASFAMRYEQAQGFQRHLLYVRRTNYSGLRVLTKTADPAPRLVRTVRSTRVAGLGGRLVAGWVDGGSPALEGREGARLRRLGPLGCWISGGQEPASRAEG